MTTLNTIAWHLSEARRWQRAGRNDLATQEIRKAEAAYPGAKLNDHEQTLVDNALFKLRGKIGMPWCLSCSGTAVSGHRVGCSLYVVAREIAAELGEVKG